MSYNWNKYDQWKLSTPWDNEPDYEVFSTQDGKYWSMDESLIDKFEKKIKRVKKLSKVTSEFIEDLSYNLCEKYGLFTSEFEAIENYLENMQSEYEYALESKYEAMREKSKLGEEY